MSLKRIKKIVLLMVLLLTSISFSETFDEVFSRAKDLYKSENYSESAKVLKGYLKRNGKKPSSEHLVPLLMESLIRLGEQRYFKKLYTIFNKKFPDSKYLPRIMYQKGIVLSNQKKYYEAVVSFSNCLQKGASSPLDSLSFANVKQLAKKKLTIKDLHSLSKRPTLHKTLLEHISYYEFARLFKENNIELAKKKSI